VKWLQLSAVRGALKSATYSIIAVGGFSCYETTYETFSPKCIL